MPSNGEKLDFMIRRHEEARANSGTNLQINNIHIIINNRTDECKHTQCSSFRIWTSDSQINACNLIGSFESAELPYS